jgi:predicted small secreted protein
MTDLSRAGPAGTNQLEGATNMLTRLLAVLMLAGFIAGCNTIEGAGKDLERGGEKIQEKADKSNNY